VTGTIAALAPNIPTPKIEYGQLSPMLLVFGAAVAGVLVEAFAPRPLRRLYARYGISEGDGDRPEPLPVAEHARV